MYICDKMMSKKDEPIVLPLIYRSEEKATTVLTWQVRVSTGVSDVEDSFTGRVNLVFEDRQAISLRNLTKIIANQESDLFRTGSTDFFYVDLKCPTELVKIEIQVVCQQRDEWFLDELALVELATNKTYVFSVRHAFVCPASNRVLNFTSQLNEKLTATSVLDYYKWFSIALPILSLLSSILIGVVYRFRRQIAGCCTCKKSDSRRRRRKPGKQPNNN